MYTAQMARSERHDNEEELDERIQAAVEEAVRYGRTSASIRVYIEDSFVHRVESELENRGFKVIDFAPICIKGDVEFSWEDNEEED